MFDYFSLRCCFCVYLQISRTRYKINNVYNTKALKHHYEKSVNMYAIKYSEVKGQILGDNWQIKIKHSNIFYKLNIPNEYHK